jgi:hypothetical protein
MSNRTVARVKSMTGSGKPEPVTRLVETRAHDIVVVATTHKECADVAARGFAKIASGAAAAVTAAEAIALEKLADEISGAAPGACGRTMWGLDKIALMGPQIRSQRAKHEEMLEMLNGAIGPEETAAVLRSLTAGKRVGADKRANEGWRAAAESEKFVVLVAKVWEGVWTTAYQPSEWMLNLVGLLYKGKGPSDLFGNYRGLTFSQHIVKAYETLLAKRLTTFFEVLKLFPDSQYGGRRGRSPIHALVLGALVMAGRRRTVVIVTDLAKAFPSTRWASVLMGYFMAGVCGKMLRMLCVMLKGMESQVEVGSETSHVYQVVAGLVEGRVLCPMSFCVTVSELSCLLAEEGCGVTVNGEKVSILQFIDDNKIYAENMAMAQKACDVLDKDAHTRGAWYNGTKTVVAQFVAPGELKEDVTLQLERQKKSTSGAPPQSETRDSAMWGHRGVRGRDGGEGPVVPEAKRLVEVTTLEHLGTHECENKSTGERQYAKQGKVRAKKGRAAMHQLSMIGGCNGGLPIADGITAAQMGTVMTLLWGCEISGRMVTPDRRVPMGDLDPGGVPVAEWAKVRKVLTQTVRRIIGGTTYQPVGVMQAELGVPTLEHMVCVSVVRAWGQMLAYDSDTKLRQVWTRQVRDLLVYGVGEEGSMAARTVWAAREVFGRQHGVWMLMHVSTKQEWMKYQTGGIRASCQRDMERALAMTATGVKFLELKPQFGLATWLQCASASPVLASNFMATRMVQMRGRGHMLQEVSRKYNGRQTSCRCAAKHGVAPVTETPAHFFFACKCNEMQRDTMWAGLQAIPCVGEAEVEKVKQGTDEEQWRWLNELMGSTAESEVQHIEGVLVVVFKFMAVSLRQHPSYGGEEEKVHAPLTSAR